jgi:predicted Zn-dependent protease
MAQMISSRLIALAVLLSSLVGSAAHAQSADPALAAEAEGRWDDAIRLHRAVVAEQPARADVWIRIADIEARQGRLTDCIEALQKAAVAAPGTASIYFRLSQAYSTAGQPTAALNAVEGALVLEPDSVEYLRARAVLSTWRADYSRAQDSYRRLAVLRPNDPDIALAFARVSAWAGDTDEAVAQYERYLKTHPEAADARIELARAESWRGNYGQAVRALDAYRERFGETAIYAETYAAVMAGAGRPARAQELIEPLLAQSPADVQLNLTRTIALAMQRRTRDALSSLETTRELAPESRDVKNAQRVVRTMLASTAEPTFTVYSDSDRLQVQRFTPRATFLFATGTQIAAGYERTRLTARAGSGLEQIDESPTADYEHVWTGVAQRVGAFTFDAQAGYAKPAARELVSYNVGTTVRASDSLQFAMHRASGALVISPRTVGLGLTQVGHRVEVQWAPTLQSMVAFDAQAQEFSDGNRRIEWTLSPRRSFARTAGFNLDLGLSAYGLSTSLDLPNGYYDPRRYEHYAVTAFPYFKLSENVGVSLSTALGAQRDSTSPAFHFGGTVSGEATFGIYEPWVLKVNGSASLNQRLDSGAFRGLSGGIALVRRF